MTNDNAKPKPGKGPVVETYDVATFSRKFGIPAGEAQTIIKRYGPSRRKLDGYMASRNA